MKRFALKTILFLALFVIALVVELCLPPWVFCYRPWEAVKVMYGSSVFPGAFYPNLDFTMTEQGDMGYYTSLAHKHRTRWVTDSYGQRTADPSRDHYDVVLVGDSFTAGASLSQEYTLEKLIEKNTGLEVYPFFVDTGVGIDPFLADPRFRKNKPNLVVFEKAEFLLGQMAAPHTDIAARELPPETIISLVVTANRLLKLPMYRFAQGRIKNMITRRANGGADVYSRLAKPAPDGKSLYSTLSLDFELTDRDIDRIAGDIIATRDVLAEKDIEFIFAGVPNKEVFLAGRTPYIGRIERKLATRGIVTAGLEEAFAEAYRHGGSYYRRDDSHWNESGARLAGGEISKRILQVLAKSGRAEQDKTK